MLIDPWQSAVSLADTFLYVWQPWQGESVSCSKHNVVDVVKLGAIRERDLSSQWIQAIDLLFDRNVRMFERRPTKSGNRLSADGCIDRVLCRRKNLVEHLV